MKKILALALVFAWFCFPALAQNCRNYLLLQNSKKVEMTIYNKRGKEDGKQIWNVNNVRSSGNSLTATVNSEMFNKSGKSLNKAVNEIKCTNGLLQMNMKMMLNQDQMKAWGENAQVKATGEFIEYPASVREGDVLKDGNLKMDIKTEQGMDMSVELSITNRKVTGKETVSSPAGNWDCFKITSTQKIVSRVAGIGIPITMDVTEWLAPGVGVVKTESRYGSTLITAIQ